MSSSELSESKMRTFFFGAGGAGGVSRESSLTLFLFPDSESETTYKHKKYLFQPTINDSLPLAGISL